MENKVFGAGGKGVESDKLNIDSIIARLLEGEWISSQQKSLPKLIIKSRRIREKQYHLTT